MKPNTNDDRDALDVGILAEASKKTSDAIIEVAPACNKAQILYDLFVHGKTTSQDKRQ